MFRHLLMGLSTLAIGMATLNSISAFDDKQVSSNPGVVSSQFRTFDKDIGTILLTKDEADLGEVLEGVGVWTLHQHDKKPEEGYIHGHFGKTDVLTQVKSELSVKDRKFDDLYLTPSAYNLAAGRNVLKGLSDLCDNLTISYTFAFPANNTNNYDRAEFVEGALDKQLTGGIIPLEYSLPQLFPTDLAEKDDHKAAIAKLAGDLKNLKWGVKAEDNVNKELPKGHIPNTGLEPEASDEFKDALKEFGITWVPSKRQWEKDGFLDELATREVARQIFIENYTKKVGAKIPDQINGFLAGIKKVGEAKEIDANSEALPADLSAFGKKIMFVTASKLA